MIYIRKQKGAETTAFTILEPFLKEIKYDNTYEYLYIQIKDGQVKGLIFSNEAREFR